ncbi:hypothetical protein JCM14076_21650 [Methylosoma difficile]
MPESPRILVIDDDSLVRLLISKALQSVGMSIEEAGSGEEGLEFFNEQRIDAVLLDVIMPGGLDGFATCREIRSQITGKHLPILMMTGLDDIDSITRAFECGATDFITKPININLLSHRIRYMLRGSKTTRQLLESQQRLHSMAYFDTLTGLPNRQFFREHLHFMVAVAARKQQKLAVLFLDLDGFKRINDTLGHHYGDKVLQAASKRLQASLRAKDLLVPKNASQEGSSLARLGGDEFTLLLTGIDNHQAAAVVAQRIISNFSHLFAIDNHELYTTTSIGIAVYPDDGETAEMLLQNADMAMYYSKRSGGNSYQFFSKHMAKAAIQSLNMDKCLRKAIENNELSLVYQPQMDTLTGRCTGVEALLRWNSAELNGVAPNEFIPHAEASGMIVSFGEWVLKTACYQAKRWHNDGLLFKRMAINISTVQLLQDGFTEMVAGVLAETGLAPYLLEFELTESAITSDETAVITALQTLKNMGIGLAIDDFGTGYSSLRRLKHFPVGRLKIDQSFITDIIEDTNSAAIVSAIIEMAEGMGMKVLAEGVETADQLKFLKNKRCQEVQGFWFCEPVKAEELEVFLLNTLENRNS